LKRPFCSSADPVAAKTYYINEYGGGDDDDDDDYLDNKIHVACSRHRIKECSFTSTA
jgi:hypothetical protein